MFRRTCGDLGLCAFMLSHTRLRVRTWHPAFPAPSFVGVWFGRTRAYHVAGRRTRIKIVDGHCGEPEFRSNQDISPVRFLDRFA
jgi:hypothetical protein